jgi:hypothetical protein
VRVFNQSVLAYAMPGLAWPYMSAKRAASSAITHHFPVDKKLASSSTLHEINGWAAARRGASIGHWTTRMKKTTSIFFTDEAVLQ